MSMQFCSFLNSPFGKLTIYSSATGITKITTENSAISENESHHTFQCRTELLDYFDGRRQKFEVNFDLSGHTEFHQSVWNELLKIPYGKTCSYLDIAKKLNNEKAIRAVGRANGLNPIPFVIPCHRVIGSDGNLTGYALGLETKRRLLALENPVAYAFQQSLFS